MRRAIVSFLVCAVSLAAADVQDRARELFERTEYQQSLALLKTEPQKNAVSLEILGQDYFMLGDYKKATDTLQKALDLDPNNPHLLHWLGRAYGRRAETANPFTAPGYATKAARDPAHSR